MTPWGPVITQPYQWWRRGEYGPVIRFYESVGIPIHKMITAAALEGGDVMIVEPGLVLIGVGETRDLWSRQPASLPVGSSRRGWERIEPIPSRYVHIDVLVAVLAEKLAAVCREVVSDIASHSLAARGGF